MHRFFNNSPQVAQHQPATVHDSGVYSAAKPVRLEPSPTADFLSVDGVGDISNNLLSHLLNQF